MNSICNSVLLMFALLLTSAASAAGYSDLYIIPVAGHALGAFGTSWRSDLVLHNIQSVPITVEIALVESGRAPSTVPLAVSAGAETTVHLMPGETRALSDVAGGLGRNITGALIVGADLPFAMTSRTWAALPAGRTLGQTVAPVAMTGTADAVNAIAVLPSLTTDTRQRSNVGLFVAASHAPLVVEIATFSATGALLASQLVVVDEPGFLHRQLPIAPAAAATSVTAVVRILEGDGIVVAYASTIDNASAEAVFVSGEPISLRGAATLAMLAKTVTAR
jgi:hypothetical protein